MNVGAAQIDITPRPGLELAGFALRPQPATAVLDPLLLRALFVEEGPTRWLWVQADLLGLEQGLADRLRAWAHSATGIPLSGILLTATHTHSGPATIPLTGCGVVDPAYVTWFEQQVQVVVRWALDKPERCRLLAAEGHCDLAVDRRGFPSAHTDPRVGALAWVRPDGTFKAVAASYGMHPVCLRTALISADWPGVAARTVMDALPGRPVVLVASGASGNLNPPGVGVTPSQLHGWGRQVGERISGGLLTAHRRDALVRTPRLRVSSATVPVPVEPWNPRALEQYAEACLADPAGEREFGSRFVLAVETWQNAMQGRVRQGQPPYARAEVGCVSLGPVSLLTLNAEVFSRFTERVASASDGRVYTVGCANGMLGYLAPPEAYAEGGYEVAWSMLFYNLPRLRRDAFELLVRQARRLVAG